ITYFFRKKYPNAFSIERLFNQLADVLENRGAEIRSVELPFYNNTLGAVWRNIRWARTRVQGSVEEQPEVVHITGDVNSIIFGLRRPTVITIHDCNPLLRYARTHPRYWFYRWFIFEWPARRAAAVTVISEKTRKELLELTSCRADNVHVIPNYVDPAYQPVPYSFRADYPTILHVGTTPNKNIARLAAALEGIPCQLRIVGQPTAVDLAALDQHAIDYTYAAGISDEAVRQHYADCDLLAFVSTYEGFGLPILEAQVTGRPVLTSNISPLKEVAGPGAAEIVDPHSVPAIRAGLLRLLQDGDHRTRLIEAGHQNAAQYRIDAVAKRYLNLYAQLSQTSQK
ncbi:MAG: glycosyltransferase family 1 protein, partial [Bacteroidota bacterium]